MNHSLCRRAVLALGLTVAVVASAGAAPPERTLTDDAVELVAGRETPGRPELTLEREGYEYQFATPENKAAFEKDPAKYEIADGGACARMGPLSGVGDARIRTVHAGRIYLFASDSCRQTFLKKPALYIESDDAVPTGTPAQVAAGRKALDRLVGWAGGAPRLKDIKSFRATGTRKFKQGDTDWTVEKEIALAFPGRCLVRESWNGSWFSTIRNPDGAAMASVLNHQLLGDSRRRAFDRTIARNPLVILRAYVDGAGEGAKPELVIVGDGEGKVADLAAQSADGAGKAADRAAREKDAAAKDKDGAAKDKDGAAKDQGAAAKDKDAAAADQPAEVEVEFVKVALRGATSRLAIEKSSGRLVQLSFQGRDGPTHVGDARRAYRKYATVAGVTLPLVHALLMDGSELRGAGLAFDAFEINPDLPAETFKITK